MASTNGGLVVPVGFPAWSTLLARGVIYGGPVLGLGLVVAPMIYVRTPFFEERLDPVKQPLQFDHRHHVQDDHIDCLFCHQTADKSPHAGYPSTDVCLGCHAQVWNQAPLLGAVRASAVSGESIPWKRVHRLPDFVYFNHAIHVGKGVGCVECHGHVEQMTVVEKVKPMTMGWCLSCHRNPSGHLRPTAEITNPNWHPTGDAAAEQKALASLNDIETRTSCTACHR